MHSLINSSIDLGDFRTLKLSPKGLLLNWANPIIAQGAAHANLTLIDRFDVDITAAIKKGDLITLNPEEGTVTVK